MTARRRLLLLLTMGLCAITLAALLRPLREEQGFQVPGPAEAQAARRLFHEVLLAGSLPASSPELAAIGLVAGEWRHGETASGLVLEEPAGHCAGRGVYLLRKPDASQPGPQMPTLLAAPHRGADRHTGTIAHLLFMEHPFAAAAWNSAPRGGGEDCPAGGDVARAAHHHFTAFSLAFAQAHPRGRVVQLHGFHPGRRDDARAQRADIIVSDGTRQPGGAILDLADCLTRSLPGHHVALYPLEAQELGGTTNAQGRALRAAGFPGFAHLELGPALRQALVKDSTLRADFAQCLAGGAA